MNLSGSPDRASPERSSRRRAKLCRWQYFWFALAAIDLLTVCASLYVSHRLTAIHARSVRLNQDWSRRLGSYSELGQLAAAVNAPGNDLFDSHDLPGESARVESARARFNEKLSAVRAEVNLEVPVAEAKPL